jgi:hypothetical protein
VARCDQVALAGAHAGWLEGLSLLQTHTTTWQHAACYMFLTGSVAAGNPCSCCPTSLLLLLLPPLVTSPGLPQTEHLRFFTGFVSSFDPRTRNPKWVLEFLDESCFTGEGTR